MVLNLRPRIENDFVEFGVTGAVPLVNDLIRSLNHYGIETFRCHRGVFEPSPFVPFTGDPILCSITLCVRIGDAAHVEAWGRVTAFRLRSS